MSDAAEEALLLKIIFILQDPIPQYVLVCLAAIVTVGTAPDNGLINKIIWIFRTLGCPFSGLFYFCNINEKEMCAYWLSSESFIKENGENIPYLPFGYHAMKLDLTQNQKKYMRKCIAEATVLDRLSSLASTYYILIGIFVGIANAIGAIGNSCSVKDWPYIPLALAWTLPVICVRVFNGKVVFKDPRKKFKVDEGKMKAIEEHNEYRVIVDDSINNKIQDEGKEEKKDEKQTVEEDSDKIEIKDVGKIHAEGKEKKDEKRTVEEDINKIHDKGKKKKNRILVKDLENHKRDSKLAHIAITAAISLLIPWITVLLAYFTKPIGFFCRSKYLTTICSIWTFNNLLAIFMHVKGEKSVSGNKFIHVWFCLCGFVMMILLALLGLLSNTQTWWIDLFGGSCDINGYC